jgi:hypothetical protein
VVETNIHKEKKEQAKLLQWLVFRNEAKKMGGVLLPLVVVVTYIHSEKTRGQLRFPQLLLL